jgi:hypothetical protein
MFTRGLVLVILTTILLPDRSAAVPAQPVAPVGHSVRLITGDAVTFTDDGTFVVDPAARAGGEPVTFTAERRGADLFVIPSDARGRIAAGTLDPGLFNVQDLARQGLSLIVNGGAVRVAATNAAAFWSGLDPAAEVWLDRKLRVSLDTSVPMIGAPVAWQGGHDGTDVTVAVLDTGVDPTHPDLAGKVVAARDFTGEGLRDGFGHGTHVATTIAGTGAASGGRFKGVAPGAKLVSGKVCDAEGNCPTSAILAGMDWAARSGARVINLSLGGAPTDGTDPLSRAVDRLSNQTGALFVVAAGNAGCPVCVSTPATAFAALAVGAVDKSDRLAEFSSRGPRLGDGAVKPEIAAPGVAITAGRAAETSMGAPLDEHYTAASGTSMATPHVAGAAALLAAAHPNWQWLQLKQVLMSTARDDGYTVFEQGSGRVDLARAYRQPVFGSASLSFGKLDSAVSKQLTYTNEGKAPVTLSLRVELRSYTGVPVSVGKLSASTVRVPAGGVASVLLAVNPFAAAPGVYSGLITATSEDGSVVVRTPVSYYLPTRTVPVTVRLLDFNGKPVTGTVTLSGGVVDNDPFRTDPFQIVSATNGVGTARLPVGTYTLWAPVFDRENKRAAWVAITNAPVTRATEFVLDARTAVLSTVDRSDVDVADHQLALSFNTGISGWSSGIGGKGFRLYATPVPPVAGPASLVLQDHLTLTGPGAVYNLSYSQDDGIPGSLTRRLDPAGLLAIETSYHADRADLRLTHAWWGFRSGASGILLQPRITLAAPARITEYVNRDDRVAWTRYAALSTADGRNNFGMYNRGPFASREDWFAGPISPTAPGFRRIDDEFRPTSFVNDSVPGHLLDVDVRNEYPIRWQLFRDGNEITPRFGLGSQVPTFPLPAGDGTYTLRSSLALRPTALLVPSLAVRQHSPRVDTQWSFRSPAAGVQPLPQLSYDLGVDLDNQAPAGVGHAISIRAAHQADAVGGAPIARLSVSYSSDDGLSWRAASVSPAGVATIDNPEAGVAVWLRVEAADEAGNTVSQTVQRAYTTR